MSAVVEFYRFTKGDNTWTITSADVPVVHNSEYYRPVAVSRSQIDNKEEIAKNELQITLPVSHEMAQSLISENPLISKLSVTVFRQLNEASPATIWKGKLASIKPSAKMLTLNCESIFTSMRRTGLMQKYQRSCRHALYGRGCNVDPALHTTNMLVSAIDGLNYTIPNAGLEADQFYTGGMLQSSGGHRTYIASHIGSAIKVHRILPDVVALDNVDVIAGCDHSRNTCLAKFDNLANYGGFDWIPLKNPLDGKTSIIS